MQRAAAALRGRSERPSYEDTLARLAAPALIVVGSQDACTTRQDAERMRDLVSDSDLVWLDGIGPLVRRRTVPARHAAAARRRSGAQHACVAAAHNATRPAITAHATASCAA